MHVIGEQRKAIRWIQSNHEEKKKATNMQYTWHFHEARVFLTLKKTILQKRLRSGLIIGVGKNRGYYLKYLAVESIGAIDVLFASSQPKGEIP